MTTNSDALVGLYGLRTFTIDRDRRVLAPLMGRRRGVDPDCWRDGVCVATCGRRRGHAAPAEECTCGIYATTHLAGIGGGIRSMMLLTVVAAEGDTIVGDDGFRTSAARVVGYWVHPDAPRDVAGIAREQLAPSGAQEFTDVDAMLAAYRIRVTPATVSTRSAQRWRAVFATADRGSQLIRTVWAAVMFAALGWTVGSMFTDGLAPGRPANSIDATLYRVAQYTDAVLRAVSGSELPLVVALLVAYVSAVRAATYSPSATPVPVRWIAGVRGVARVMLAVVAGPIAFLAARHIIPAPSLVVAGVAAIAVWWAAPHIVRWAVRDRDSDAPRRRGLMRRR